MRFPPAICCRRQSNEILTGAAMPRPSHRFGAYVRQMYSTVSSRCILRFCLCECLIFGCAHIYSPQILYHGRWVNFTHRKPNISIQFESSSSSSRCSPVVVIHIRFVSDGLSLCVRSFVVCILYLPAIIMLGWRVGGHIAMAYWGLEVGNINGLCIDGMAT